MSLESFTFNLYQNNNGPFAWLENMHRFTCKNAIYYYVTKSLSIQFVPLEKIQEYYEFCSKLCLHHVLDKIMPKDMLNFSLGNR